MAVTKRKIIPLTAKRAAPFYDPERDGVTQGLLGAFKSCRQLARDILDGWSGREPSFPLTYGGLTHYVLNQAYDNVLIHQDRTIPTEKMVVRWLEQARRIWLDEHPVHAPKALEMVEESIMKLSAILPWYFRYWKTDFTKRLWLHIENEFRIPVQVTLPSGRVVRTFWRGKIDGAFVNPKSKPPRRPRLMESKTRAQIDEELIIDTLPMNLQTNLYINALAEMGHPPEQVELNIIRKTLLRQGKHESPEQYETRIGQDVKNRQDWYFVRMKMTIEPGDIEKSRRDLMQILTDFLMWWYGEAPHYRNDQSCALYHRPCDMLKKCAYGDTSGLFKRKRVFSELEDE